MKQALFTGLVVFVFIMLGGLLVAGAYHRITAPPRYTVHVFYDGATMCCELSTWRRLECNTGISIINPTNFIDSGKACQ